ncbi:MAG: hypothetical protein EPO23_12470 [Xanthobacteraceae bacterium]|nr:MAG: hypothetical protein EPO23_12470 [Xanthobacteraceae bacterium]
MIWCLPPLEVAWLSIIASAWFQWPGWQRSAVRTRLSSNSLQSGNFAGNLALFWQPSPYGARKIALNQAPDKIPLFSEQGIITLNQRFSLREQRIANKDVVRDRLHRH